MNLFSLKGHVKKAVAVLLVLFWGYLWDFVNLLKYFLGSLLVGYLSHNLKKGTVTPFYNFTEIF